MGWRHRCRRGQRGRFPKPITIQGTSPITAFSPTPQLNQDPVLLESVELESLRLVDLEGLSQEEAGEKMGVSRGTVWRLIQGARKKVAIAFVEGRPIIISENNRSPEKP